MGRDVESFVTTVSAETHAAIVELLSGVGCALAPVRWFGLVARCVEGKESEISVYLEQAARHAGRAGNVRLVGTVTRGVVDGVRGMTGASKLYRATEANRGRAIILWALAEGFVPSHALCSRACVA